MYGWRSYSGASSTPVWSHSYPLCSSNLFTGGSYVSVEASDNGGVLVALLDQQDTPTGNVTAHAYVYDGPTGNLNFVRDLSVPASQGQVQVTPSGAWVILLEEDNGNGGLLWVMDARTGQVRGGSPVSTPFFIAAAISDDGACAARARGLVGACARGGRGRGPRVVPRAPPSAPLHPLRPAAAAHPRRDRRQHARHRR